MFEFSTQCGQFYSPYQIYIRCAERYGIRDVPKLLGLNYRFWKYRRWQQVMAIVCEVDDWLMIGDDLSYTLRNRKGIRSAVASLGSRFDLFAFSVGDMDLSLDLVTYSAGKRIREIRVDSPNSSDRVLSVDFGSRLNGEIEFEDIREIGDEEAYVAAIASSVGIRCPNARDPAMFCYPPWSLFRG